MTTEKIWVEHAADMVRAIRVLETMTKDLNADNGVSDLEFMIPTSIDVRIYGASPSFRLVMEDQAWYIEIVGDVK